MYGVSEVFIAPFSICVLKRRTQCSIIKFEKSANFGAIKKFEVDIIVKPLPYAKKKKITFNSSLHFHPQLIEHYFDSLYLVYLKKVLPFLGHLIFQVASRRFVNT